MKKRFKIIFLFVLLMVFIPVNILAKNNNSNEIINGTYQFSAIEGNNKQLQNTFLYKDSDFTVSSFKGSKSLEVLSIQLAAASLSYYGENLDKYELDYSRNDYNIRDFMGKMKFNNIESNKYYNSEKKENSVGVIIGSKTIVQDGKEYTLLAIIPRSAGYKQEWAGNFEVGEGDLHEGFKSARDEILRFTKQYLNKNNIKGNLKVWTTGYSRGAAISNMVGGFFAGGGIEYFGSEVKIKPEDVYCYTIGTPSSIKDGASKNSELSVSANRNSSDYVNDTVSSAFNYTKGGKVSLKSSVYNGIRSVISSDDSFAMFPPEEWGFTRYGNVVNSNDGLYSVDEMLKELESISKYVYDAYSPNDKIKDFSEKTFDLKTLSIVDKKSNVTQSKFFKGRINGLVSKISTNKKYYDKYQDALKSSIGTYGMLATLIDDISDQNSLTTTELITPLLYSYFAYASDELQLEGRASNDSEAMTIIVSDLLSHYSEENLDYKTFTVDDFVKVVMKYLADNENEPISAAAISGIKSIVPENYQTILSALTAFSKNKEVEVDQGIKDFIRACYYGVDSESSIYPTYQTAEETRQMLYMFLLAALGDDSQELQDLMMGQGGVIDGHGKFVDFVEYMFPKLMVEKDDNGNVIKTYNSLDELADDKLVYLLDNLLVNGINKSRELYGEDYKNDLQKQVNGMKQNISSVREFLSLLFFYNEGKFNTVKSLENAITFVDNASLFAMPHFDEIYLALSRTSNRYDDEYVCIDGNGQNIDSGSDKDLTLVFSFDYYLFNERGKLFIDGVEVPRDKYEISKGSTIITIKSSYLNTLGGGRHEVVAKVNNDSADAYFTVDNGQGNNNEMSNDSSKEYFKRINNETSPKTGDDIAKYLVLFVGSFSLLLVSLLLRKKYVLK